MEIKKDKKDMKDNSLISLIIPVYNTSEYLSRAVESAISQTLQNIELILVDDGSNDGSEEICNSYARKHKNVHVLHKENDGVTSARKRGLNVARGDYIGFMDSDDWIEPNMYENLLSLAIIHDADIVCSGYYMDSRDTIEIDGLPEGLYDDKLFLMNNLIYLENTEEKGIDASNWSKLFRKSVLYDNYMNLDNAITLSEDMAVTIASILDSKRVFISHKSYYHYTKRKDSATASSDPLFFERISKMLEYVREKLSLTEHTIGLERQIDIYTDKMIMSGLMLNYKYYQEGTIPPYVFPPGLFDKKSRLVLYGAGFYGRQYHRQFNKRNGYNLVLWIDKKADEYTDEVKNVDDLLKVDFDVLVIAVKDDKMAKSITDELIYMGIPKEKILWEKPVSIMECI